MNKNDFEVRQQETLYKGFFRLERYHLKHRLFDGGWSEVFQREVFERGESAAVLLFDPELDEFVLIEQFRPGAIRDAHSPWLVELVAGMVEDGEQPDTVVKREALEEAGCNLVDLLPIVTYWVSPGGTTERVHLFCGRTDASKAPSRAGLVEEHEDIRVLRTERKTAYEWVRNGRIDNAMTLLALQWFELNEAEIRTGWQ